MYTNVYIIAYMSCMEVVYGMVISCMVMYLLYGTEDSLRKQKHIAIGIFLYW